MINTCPNPNDPNWKTLVELIGEDKAYEEYYKYGGEIPNPDLYSKTETKDEKPLTSTELSQLAKSFFQRFKVPFEVISRDKANKLGIPATTKGAWDKNSNKVFLIESESGFYTTLHEFTHPFVEYISKANPTLYTMLVNKLKVEGLNSDKWMSFLVDNGYGNLIKNGQITDDGWKEILTQEIEKASKEILNNAPETDFIKNVKIFWNKVRELLSTITGFNFKNISDKSLLNLNIKDLAMFMLGDEKLDLFNGLFTNKPPYEGDSQFFFKNASTTFTSSVSAQIASYKERTGKDVTQKQLDVLNILLQKQNFVLGEDGYLDPTTSENYKRATAYISEIDGPNKEPQYFGYNSDEDYGVNARTWGNQVDKLVEFIIDGVDKETAISNVIDFHNNNAENKDAIVSEEVLRELYDDISSLIYNKYKNYIILPQVILADEKTKIAGRADIILISPEGNLKIVDIKTTSKDTTGKAYSQAYAGAASKKQIHSAQLTVYKGLAKSMGLTFDESNDLVVFPIYFPNTSQDIINQAVIQPEVSIQSFKYILDSFVENNPLLIDEFEDSKEGMLIKKMRVLLEKRLSDLSKIPDSARKYVLTEEVKETINTINQSEPIKKLTEFVNSMHKQFADTKYKTKDGEKTNFGLGSQIKYIAIKLSTGKIKTEEAFAQLKHIKDVYDLYSPLLDDVRNIVNSKEDAIRSEMMVKLEDIQNNMAVIKEAYEDTAIDLLTDTLSENISYKANETAKKELEALKDRMNKETDSKKKEKRKADYEKALKQFRSEEGITKEVIRKALKEGSATDIGFLDRWLTPAASSSNELIGTFSRLLKDKMEDARQELIDFERKAANEFLKLDSSGKDNPAEFNKGLYEKVSFFKELNDEGVPVFEDRMVFVSEIDLNALERAKAELQVKLSKTELKNQSAVISKFYKDNYELRPKEDITINGVVIEKGLNTLLKEKKELLDKNIISQKDFDNFKLSFAGYTKNGVTYYNKELLIPKRNKFKNPKFDEIPSSKKQYYNFLVSSYFKSQERLPHKLGYILPSIHKSGNDALRDGGLWKYIKYSASNLISIKEEDIDKYGDDSNSIPLIYNFSMKPEDISLDLIQSVILYEAESLEYKAKSEVADTGNILLSIVQKNSPYKTDELGNKFIDSFADKAGVKDEFLRYKKKLGDNYVAALLSMYIDSQIYGKLNIKSEAKVFGINIDKLTSGIMSFASFTQIGGNPIASAANYLQANVQANIDAAAKDRVSDLSWQKSRLIYDKSLPDFMKDFNSPYSKSLLGQLVDLYDPMQGEYKDKAGRKISKSMFKKLWSTDTWFFLQQMGEHSIQVRTMIAMMLDTKVTKPDGTITNLYDSYELDSTGKIKLKDGYKLPGKMSYNGKISRDFQASLHALNKRLHGVYNTQDRPDIERYWWGRLFVMYKKFLAPGLKRRYKSRGYDFEYGDITEGYWITFHRALLRDTAKLARFVSGLDKSNYFTEFEKQNLRRSLREMMIVAATGFAVIILNSLLEAADDEDEKRNIRRLLYTTMRLNNELGVYGTFGDPQNFFIPNAGEMYKTIKNPIAAFSVTNKLQKLLQQLTDPTAVYERDSGIWEKGDSKLWATFLKFWGYNGTNTDPENAIKYMNMTTK